MGVEDIPDMGIYKNLTYENFTPSQLIKSFLTGIAEELHELYKLMPEAVRLGRVAIAASGNGIRKNPLLVHRIEKLFKVPVRLGGNRKMLLLELFVQLLAVKSDQTFIFRYV